MYLLSFTILFSEHAGYGTIIAKSQCTKRNQSHTYANHRGGSACPLTIFGFIGRSFRVTDSTCPRVNRKQVVPFDLEFSDIVIDISWQPDISVIITCWVGDRSTCRSKLSLPAIPQICSSRPLVATPNIRGLFGTVDSDAHGTLRVERTGSKTKPVKGLDKVHMSGSRNVRGNIRLDWPWPSDLFGREIVDVVRSISSLVRHEDIVASSGP